MEKSITISSTNDIQLDAKLYLNPKSCIGVVIAHPYGPMGGDLENNVVQAMTSLFATMGMTTCRFNFRSGTSWTGQAEQDDARAVGKHVLSVLPEGSKQLLWCGYSYGSMILGSVAHEFPETNGFVAISYPYSVLWFLSLFSGSKYVESLGKLKVPKCMILGDSDQWTGVSKFQSFVAGLPDPKECIIAPGVDHFWGYNEKRLQGLVETWYTRTFGQLE